LQFFLTGLVLFGLGLLGEYVGRIYQQVRGRPRYLIQAVLESGQAAGVTSAESSSVSPTPHSSLLTPHPK
jgi:undecaprenyl-phosphate 4-deoxy-4-formamido-L-arabinose transferase